MKDNLSNKELVREYLKWSKYEPVSSKEEKLIPMMESVLANNYEKQDSLVVNYYIETQPLEEIIHNKTDKKDLEVAKNLIDTALKMDSESLKRFIKLNKKERSYNALSKPETFGIYLVEKEYNHRLSLTKSRRTR